MYLLLSTGGSIIKILLLFLILLCYGCVTRGEVKHEVIPEIILKIIPEIIPKVRTEREGILKIFEEDKIIILAYEKLYDNTFDLARNFYQYKKSTDEVSYDGFWIWLTKNLWFKNIFESGDKWGIGDEIIKLRFGNPDYIVIKKNYELLKELAEKGMLNNEKIEKEVFL